jgi:hypothetical protein
MKPACPAQRGVYVAPADREAPSPTGAPEVWIVADRAGNKVCIAAWPDGATARSTAGRG